MNPFEEHRTLQRTGQREQKSARFCGADPGSSIQYLASDFRCGSVLLAPSAVLLALKVPLSRLVQHADGISLKQVSLLA